MYQIYQQCWCSLRRIKNERKYLNGKYIFIKGTHKEYEKANDEMQFLCENFLNNQYVLIDMSTKMIVGVNLQMV